jgi:cytochrome c553
MLSVIAAAILFGGCGDKTKEAATDAAAKAVESTKEATSHVADAAKETADKAAEAVKEAGDTISEATDKVVEATKEAAEATKETASEAVDSAKEGVAAATAAVAGTVENAAGAAVYKKCAGCHGVDGKTKALGKSAVISGQSKEDLVTKISGYKAGTLDTAGMGTLMKGQVSSLSDTEIDALAAYISTLK